MKSILIYSEISWNFLDQRHHHLARYAALNGYRVEFIQRVVSRTPSLKELLNLLKQRYIIKSNKVIEKEVPCGIHVRNSWFLPPSSFLPNVYNWILWFLFERPRQANAIIYSFVNNPQILGGKYPFLAKHSKSVFDVIHNWWEFPWYNEAQKRKVDANLKLFDKVVTDSPIIAARLGESGVLNHLMMPGLAQDWLNISSSNLNIRPVFFGNLRSNSDLDLVDKMALKFGLDLMGLIDKSAAHATRNARYIGAFSVFELVGKVSEYNAILLPYDNGEFSKTIAPAKYFEALATGALVVTRAEMKHLPGFDEYIVKLNDLSEASLEGLKDALVKQQSNRGSQIEFAKQHLWEKRFSNLFEFLEVN